MKTNITRIAAVTAATALSFSAFSSGISASAADSESRFSYRICENGTRERTIYIDKNELEKGDYTINTAIYIETDASPENIKSACTIWNGYDDEGIITKYITFDNCSPYSDENDLLTTDAFYATLNDSEIIDGITASSAFAPSCFSSIRERSSGTQLLHWFGTPMLVNNVADIKTPYGIPDESNTLYSAGPYKVYFESEYLGETIYLDLDYDDRTGTATAAYSYPSYANPDVNLEGSVNIKHYDPDTPVGEPIKLVHNWVDLVGLSAPTSEWYGGSSDYLPFITFDSIIDKDTPAGTYYVAFTISDTIRNSMLGRNGEYAMELIADNANSNINDESYWLKIVVGDSAETDEEAVYDVNLDGTIGVDDAAEVLRIYAETAAGTNSDIQIQQAANVNADVNGNGIVNIDDAAAILTKYAENAASI